MRFFKLFIILIFTGLLFGCVSPAQVDKMAAKETTTMIFSENLHKNIKLNEVGSIGGYGIVKGSDFELALFKTLKNLDLIALNNTPKYELSAQVMDIKEPLGGGSLTVTSKIKYLLIENSTQKVLINKTISSPYTAHFSDALIGVTRLKLANEGSVRINIMSFLKELSELQLEPEM